MTEPRALTVSEAMGLAKRALETVQVRVVGEVSELSDKQAYKGVYFSVADGGAVMPCMMWRDAYEAAGVRLRCGMLVEIGGSFGVYAPKGRMQFIVRSLSAAGEGTLRLQVAALARRLETEGLMRPERKRPLPSFPERIGLVTSPRGKAVHDVVRTLRRRYPAAELVVAGVAVEGANAIADIAAGLRAVDAAGVDVVVLGRGGGSYEDLMPFNAEEVARAVVATSVPVVTGIGHEPDTTIADMVADLRASTPTAAAEAVSPDSREVDDRFVGLSRLLGRALRHAVQHERHRLAVLASRPVLLQPRMLCETRAQTLDLLTADLSRALPAAMRRERERAQRLRHDLVAVAKGLIDRGRVDVLAHRLSGAGERTVDEASNRIAIAAAGLDALSPLAILSRGYAVCFDEAGRRVVRSADDVTPGDRVRVRFGTGSAGCVVESVETEA